MTVSPSSTTTTQGAPEAPGPRGWPLLGVLPRVARNPLEALTGIAREYGDIVRVPLGPRAVYLVTHPDLIKHVLVDNSAGYSKGRTWEKTRSYLGDGLATAEGELWRRQRRLMQPQFHRDAVGSLAGVIADNIAVTIDHLGQAADEDRVVDLAAELMNMTLGVLKATVFGGTATDTTGFTDAFQVALAHTTARVLAPIDVPDTWPTPGNRRFREAKAHLDRVVFGVIRERSAEPDRPDLLSLLLHSKDPETGAVMGDTQLRDEVITLFLGGSETTANALAWAFYLLGQHQDVEERVAAEAREVIGERRPGADDLKRLQLCTAVFEEAMRLYPQNWVMSRDTIGEDVVGGYRVPARTTVFLGVHALHRDGRFWSDPERFLPERFFAANAVGRHPFAYLPFGGGQRKCIGNMFALLEGSFALAQIARAFVVEPVAGHTVVADPKFNLRPKTGIRVRLRRRSHR